MTTLTKIRKMLSDAYRETALYGNETYYPATWRYGAGVGDASTACRGEHRRGVTSEFIAGELGLRMDFMEFEDCPRLRDCADMIANELRTQAARDAAVDLTADAPILTA